MAGPHAIGVEGAEDGRILVASPVGAGGGRTPNLSGSFADLPPPPSTIAPRPRAT